MKKSLLSLLVIFGLIGCTETNAYDSSDDRENTLDIGAKLASNQPTPTDIDYSLDVTI